MFGPCYFILLFQRCLLVALPGFCINIFGCVCFLFGFLVSSLLPGLVLEAAISSSGILAPLLESVTGS